MGPLLFLVPVLALAAPGSHQPEPPGSTFSVVARPIALDAPADEYFGPYKLSNLGVRNAIYDMTVEGNSPLALPLQVERITAVEDALAVWADRYPYDQWLPPAMWKFSLFLLTKGVPQYDRDAWALLQLLVVRYPDTWYGRNAAQRLAGLDLPPSAAEFDDPQPFVVPALKSAPRVR
jgi:hypothetical protein